MENYLPIVSSLLSKKADPNIQDNDWWTPIHAAAHGGHWRICNLLFNSGADPLSVSLSLQVVCCGDSQARISCVGYHTR